jgi:hypothetical protein
VATLETLAGYFVALFERMQTPAAGAAMKMAFAMTRAELGRAAVKDKQASRAPRRTRG